jgi:hypothetical protein
MLDSIIKRLWRQLSGEDIWTYAPIVVVMLALSLIYSILLQSHPNNRQFLRIVFCFLATLALALFCGLRHMSVGTDTERYYHMIGDEFSISVEQVIDNFLPNRLENQDAQQIPRDVVFYIISDQMRMLGLSEYGVFCVYALFYVGVAGWLIYRYSVSPVVAFFTFMALGVYVFGFTGLRQAIAMGWTMLAYPFIQRRKLLFFTFFVLVGMLFHKSALVFFPAYFIVHRRIRLSFVLILCAVAFYLFSHANNLSSYIVQYLGSLDDRVEGYFGSADEELNRSFSTCIIRFVIFFLFIIVCGRKVFTKEETIWVNMLFIGAIFELFSIKGWAGMPRLGLYYSGYTMLLMPNLIERAKHYIPLPYAITVATFAALASLYFMKVISVFGPYHFNWYGWINVG